MSEAVAIREEASVETPAIAYERGRNEILLAVNVDDVKAIRDKAEALRRYWLQRKDKDMEAALSAIRLRAEYEIGVRSKALEKDAGPGRGKKIFPLEKSFTGKVATLKTAGITPKAALASEALTELVTAKDVDAFCKQAIESRTPVKSVTAFLKQHKDDQAKAAFHQVKALIPSNLHVGDFRDTAKVIPDASIDLVFTDPPYEREAIPLYEAAAKEAARVLKPGGSLICYSGHLILPDVLTLMQAHINYFWIGADVHDGGQMSRMQQFGIIAGFKPLLWFVKGKRGDKQSFVCDTVLSKREKGFHPWQQAIAVAEHFIAGLTADTGIVVDFFAGGGTTLLAARNLKRSWHGFEVDQKAVATIMERLR
jgi:SAM-dependent methyltransferase